VFARSSYRDKKKLSVSTLPFFVRRFTIGAVAETDSMRVAEIVPVLDEAMGEIQQLDR
jgi:hypothetical protein